MIFRFELRPGEALVERRLEKLLGYSRTSVRTALARLEQEGLVRRREQHFVVTPIDATELEEAYEFRIVLERKALRLAAAGREDACDQLDTLLTDMELADELPADEWIHLSTEFHLSLAELSGNRFLAEGLRSVLPRIYRARVLEVSEARERGQHEHRDIVRLMREGRIADAEDLLDVHLARSRDRLLSTISSLGLTLAARGVELA